MTLVIRNTVIRNIVAASAFGAAASFAVAGAAWASATGADHDAALEACAAAVAAELDIAADTLDVDVARRRTRASVIKLNLRVFDAEGSRTTAYCEYNFRDAEVVELTVG